MTVPATLQPLATRSIRGAVLALGVAVSGVGLILAFVPGATQPVPVEAVITALGSDYVVVAVLGLLAVGLSGLIVVSRQVRGVDEVTPPVVEGVQSADYPGHSVDNAAETGWGFRRTTAPDPRPRLDAAAVRATMRADGCSRAAAERQVAEGSWTDDAVAARYLLDSGHDSGRASATRHDRPRLRRTVDAIVRRSDGTEDGR